MKFSDIFWEGGQKGFYNEFLKKKKSELLGELFGQIRKISIGVNLKIFKEKTDKPQFLVKTEGFLTLPQSFFGFRPPKKILNMDLYHLGYFLLKKF